MEKNHWKKGVKDYQIYSDCEIVSPPEHAKQHKNSDVQAGEINMQLA